MSHAATSHKDYYVVFIVLLLLVGVTVEAGRHDLGHFGFPVAMLIAGIKAGLIVWYFMKLRQSWVLTRLFAAASLLFLLILFAHTASDYLTRAGL